MDAANTVTNPDGIGTPSAGLAALRSSFTYAQFDNLVINSSQPPAFPHALFDKHLLVPPRPSPRVDQDPAVPRSDFNGLVGCRFRVGTTPLVADALARFAGLSNGSHELSILDGTTFLVVARATLDLAGGGDLTGSLGVRHHSLPPVTLAAGTQYLLLSFESNRSSDVFYDLNTWVQERPGLLSGWPTPT